MQHKVWLFKTCHIFSYFYSPNPTPSLPLPTIKFMTSVYSIVQGGHWRHRRGGAEKIGSDKHHKGEHWISSIFLGTKKTPAMLIIFRCPYAKLHIYVLHCVNGLGWDIYSLALQHLHFLYDFEHQNFFPMLFCLCSVNRGASKTQYKRVISDPLC